MKKILLLLLISCFVKQTAQTKLSIMFYNCENFFDTIHNPITKNDEFNPSAESQWNTKKYKNKINHITQVFDSIGIDKNWPDIIGLCEIENITVLNDLINKNTLNNKNYKALVSTGLDERGINVGFIYNQKKFDCIASSEINATNIQLGDYKTRNILQIELKFKQTNEIIYFFINHWPSRRDGETVTEVKRIYAAQVLKENITKLLAKNNNSKIIIMGDLNDTPLNTSVLNELKAVETPKENTAELFNPYYEKAKANKGTHENRGKWQLFDQIILSQGFLKTKGLKYKQGNAFIMDKNFVMFNNKKTGEIKPNRTYGSHFKYYNGYSDHLAVYIALEY
ncbi:MAG: hypothetical protein JSU07_06515 [Bacteroidetes bacterium]|nr:hypothetical protein [Bacteroidota bacterium]